MTSQSPNELARNWPLLATTIIGISLPGAAFYVLGQVTRQLETEFGWSRTDVSAGLTVSLLITFFLQPIVGRLVDVSSARLLAICGAILSGLAMAGFSLADGSRTGWILLWCVQSFATAMTSPTVWICVFNGRFTVYKSFAIGIAMCGAGVAGGLAPPTMRFLMDTFDWRTAYQLMALFWCGSGVLMTLFFFFDDRPHRAASPSARSEKRPGQMRKLFLTANFVKIAISILLLMGAVSAFMLHLSPALVDNGFSRETAATLAGIGGGFGGIAGKLSMGWLFDRVRLSLVTLGMTCTFGLACILMALGVQQLGAAVVACLIMGAAGGAILTITGCLTTRFFPPEHFGIVYGALGSVMALSTAFGPVSASLIHDQVGSYTPAFWVGLAIAVVSTALLTSLAPIPALEHPSAAPVEAF